MRYTVEHMQGVAGIDEAAVERFENIEAESGIDAIRQSVGGIPADWIATVDGRISSLMNPEVTNRPGQYCDYWLAEEVESDINANA